MGAPTASSEPGRGFEDGPCFADRRSRLQAVGKESDGLATTGQSALKSGRIAWTRQKI